MAEPIVTVCRGFLQLTSQHYYLELLCRVF
jgi:hypothetical protein